MKQHMHLYNHKALVRILSIPALLITVIYYSLIYVIRIIPILYFPTIIHNFFINSIIWINLITLVIPCLLLSLYPEEIHFVSYAAMLTISLLLSFIMSTYLYYFLGVIPSLLGIEALIVSYLIKNQENLQFSYKDKKPRIPFYLTLLGGIASLLITIVMYLTTKIFSVSFFIPLYLIAAFGAISTVIISTYMYKNDERKVKLGGVLVLLFSTLASMPFINVFSVVALIGGILAIVWKPI
jgi:hypothetical protein